MTTPVRYYIVRDEDQPVVRLVAVDVRASEAGESAPVAAKAAPGNRGSEARKRPSVGNVVKAATRRARNAS